MTSPRLRHRLQAGIFAALYRWTENFCRGLDCAQIEDAGRRLGQTIALFRPTLRAEVVAAIDRQGIDQAAVWADRFFTDQLGRTIIEGFLTCRSFQQHPFEFPVALENFETFIEARHTGRGVLIVSAHYGNWELIPQWLAFLGHPMHSVQRLHRNPLLHEAISGLRQANGSRTIDFHRRRPEAFTRCLRVLKEGGVLGAMIDVAPKTRFLKVPFLGKAYGVPQGPALLAAMTGATVLPTFCVRTSAGYSLIFEDPVLPVAEKSRAEVAHAMTRDLAARVEAHVRQRPDHWLWILEGWRRLPFIRP